MMKKLILIVVCLASAFQAAHSKCTEEEEAQCKLPDCLCPSLSVPGGLEPSNIPQIVFLTFDDGINTINYHLYEELFSERVNPNGQPITISLYVTHEYTDYSLVHQLWRRGHDIALHSITHLTNTQYWKELDGPGWKGEVVDQKKQLAYFANIPEDDIVGFRGPFLQTGGDCMMEQLYGVLKYDASRPTQTYIDPGLWPYTLDFDTEFQDCSVEPCATGVYPGFWNVPMISLIGGNDFPCAMMDTCLPQPNTTEQTLELFTRNFLRHYEGNRAPFGLFTHSAWLADTFPGHKTGYVEFLDYLKTLDDVYIVSVARGLEWVKNPTPLETIKDFPPWHVNLLDVDCEPKNSCKFDAEDTPGFPSERYMTCCQSCPNKYPWLDNPLGESTRANKFDRH